MGKGLGKPFFEKMGNNCTSTEEGNYRGREVLGFTIR